MNLCFYVKVAD